MGVTTWLDRITDESNLWLSATKAEEAREYPAAVIQYLSDATACLNRDSQVRAALSCYCAADSLASMGAAKEAKRLYYQAGRLYAGIADHSVSGSIREGLWALQRAYACYVHAGLTKEAEAARESFLLLARRANPFSSGSDWLEMPNVVPREFPAAGSGRTEIPAEVVKAVERFLSMSGRGTQGIEDRAPSLKRPRGVTDDQESIVSQLG